MLVDRVDGKKQAVWQTAQPRKERPIESHGRKSHGTQPVEPLRGGLTEGANAKVYTGHVYGRTLTAGRRPPLIDSWSETIGLAIVTKGSFSAPSRYPGWKTCQQRYAELHR